MAVEQQGAQAPEELRVAKLLQWCGHGGVEVVGGLELSLADAEDTTIQVKADKDNTEAGKKRLTKVLMDGGSGLNTLYVDTLDAMRIPRSELRRVSSPFHGMIPRTQTYPLGQIDLPVTFGDQSNFRSEVLTFEVVGFLGSYHAILGRPCYAKFVVIPNYTCLKLKMPEPNDVITVGSTFSHSYTCDHEHYELTTTVINSAELPQLENLLTPVVLDYNKPTSSTVFHPTEETKVVGIDPTDPTKMVWIGAKLPAK
ncbi:uncharacterized protein [Miscanthus floridulus]|uniref:uncharacterized protein n=1 Tax=Miscanthus floridulus TaxID=154761 RepID=UPI00345B123E